jgi:hypothetical protein
LAVTTSGVSAATVDMARAGLSLDQPLTLDVQASGPLALQVGERLVQLPAGHTTTVLRPSRGRLKPAREELPATGGGLLTGTASACLLAALALRRRRRA